MRSRVRLALAGAVLLAGVPLSAQQPKKSAKPKRPAASTPAPRPADPPAPDLAITAEYVAGGRTTRSTVLLHAARQRIDYETDLATLQQCDAAQSIQLNKSTGVYLAAPFDAPSPVTADAGPAKKKGGTITYTTTITDTGEKKDVFGFPARRVRTTIAKQASADAWDRKPETVEIDGWYIDLPPTATCDGAPPPSTEVRVDPKDASRRDLVTFVRAQAAPATRSATP